MLAAGLAVAVVVAGYRAHLHRKAGDEGRYCTNQLMMIDTAKEFAALKLGIMKGLIITGAQIAPYCRDGVMPRCPCGGHYTLNIVGRDPECSACNPKARAGTDEAGWHRLPPEDEVERR